MSNLGFSEEILIAATIFVAVFLLVAATALSASRHAVTRSRISRRLNAYAPVIGTQQELVRIRRKRSLSSEGHYLVPFTPLNRLVLQSGSTLGFYVWLALMAFLALGGFVAGSILTDSIGLALAATLFTGLAVPIWTLREMRDRRQQRFEEQLPDAIDILVRSLKAGHAVPVAITAVARDMPNPIGSEFAITAGELAYGLDLETALVNLRTRVGQGDLALIAVAVSIQSKTGAISRKSWAICSGSYASASSCAARRALFRPKGGSRRCC